MNTAGASDADLVKQVAQRGEDGRRAERELCRRFAPRVRLYGLRHLRDQERVRDLAQSVLMALLEAARAGRIEECAKVDRFVLGTCRNVAARLREREKRDAPAAGDEEAIGAAAAPDADPIELIALTRCLGALELRARTVVCLSFQDGRDAEEIGALLAMTGGNVRVVRHRAIAALRACLDGVEASP